MNVYTNVKSNMNKDVFVSDFDMYAGQRHADIPHFLKALNRR